MSHWQVTLKSPLGQVMSFGVEAPDRTSAFQRALDKAPFAPDEYSLTEIAPPCRKHRARHDCPDGTLRVQCDCDCKLCDIDAHCGRTYARCYA